jgi:Arc/MetJ-type ribon-helix-helix transcriptional regulator
LTKFYDFDNIVIQNITINFKHMREVINISLPAPMAKTVKKAVKTGDYSSTSEFFRKLLRDWQEGKLLSELNESQMDIACGKGKILKSLKSLR